MTETISAYVLTAILSPIVCFVVYLFWKGTQEVKKIERRHELQESIADDYVTRAAILKLITDKMESDWMFQQAITTLVITQLEKDWKLEKAVISIAKKA